MKQPALRDIERCWERLHLNDSAPAVSFEMAAFDRLRSQSSSTGYTEVTVPHKPHTQCTTALHTSRSSTLSSLRLMAASLGEQVINEAHMGEIVEARAVHLRGDRLGSLRTGGKESGRNEGFRSGRGEKTMEDNRIGNAMLKTH